MQPKRGEVWWVKLDPTVGSEIRKTRPCVVVTNDVFNRRRNTVIVVPISSSERVSLPLTVAVHTDKIRGVAAIEQVRAVSKERMTTQLDVLGEDLMQQIASALKTLLDME